MPLIRYRIGDIGTPQEYKKCACGCSYPKLQKVTGRTTDMFKTINKSVFHGTYFHGLFWYKNWIKAFQVIQKRLDLIIVRFVTEGEVPKEDLADIEEKIKIVIGQNCTVVFEFVDSIPKTKTGKYLYTISEV
jgi:phenylacetate-CoA ligase